MHGHHPYMTVVLYTPLYCAIVVERIESNSSFQIRFPARVTILAIVIVARISPSLLECIGFPPLPLDLF